MANQEEKIPINWPRLLVKFVLMLITGYIAYRSFDIVSKTVMDPSAGSMSSKIGWGTVAGLITLSMAGSLALSLTENSSYGFSLFTLF
jgi:hypothetical protein